jgi:hypothetical protein
MGRTPWAGDQSDARLVPHRRIQEQNERSHRHPNLVGFEPTVSMFERTKTVHALDSPATLISPTVQVYQIEFLVQFLINSLFKCLKYLIFFHVMSVQIIKFLCFSKFSLIYLPSCPDHHFCFYVCMFLCLYVFLNFL